MTDEVSSIANFKTMLRIKRRNRNSSRKRQKVNQFDVNRTQVLLPDGFCACIEIYKWE